MGEAFLNSPSAFVADGPNIVVGELFARLAILDPDDRLVGYLGGNGEVRQTPGWPNASEPASTRLALRTCGPGISTAPMA